MRRRIRQPGREQAHVRQRSTRGVGHPFNHLVFQRIRSDICPDNFGRDDPCGRLLCGAILSSSAQQRLSNASSQILEYKMSTPFTRANRRASWHSEQYPTLCKTTGQTMTYRRFVVRFSAPKLATVTSRNRQRSFCRARFRRGSLFIFGSWPEPSWP
jgi:hypothetical protein